MKNVKQLLLSALAVVLCLAACEEKTSLSDESGAVLPALAVLNEGNMGDNLSSVLIYDEEQGKFADLFYASNGKGLGDTGNDMIVVGDDIFIAVSGSRIIFVTDKNFRIKKEIVASSGGIGLTPRHLATDGKRAYVTYYEGYLGEIDPSDGYKVRTTAVGPNPEGVAYAGGKLYVANSGGYNYPDYNNTVSVVDAASFTEISTIEVNANPCLVVANALGTALYVSSSGNYGDIPPMLQKVELSTGNVSRLDYDGTSSIASGKDDRLYVLCTGYDVQWNPLPGTVYTYNMSADSKEGIFAEGIEKAYKVSADVEDGYVFVTASDYKNTGDMFVYSFDGKKVVEIDTKGLNPCKGLVIR